MQLGQPQSAFANRKESSIGRVIGQLIMQLGQPQSAFANRKLSSIGRVIGNV